MRKSKHHLRPRSLLGKDVSQNISYVCSKKHAAWHVLFGNMHALQIACELNNKYLKETVFTIHMKGKPDHIILGGNDSNNLLKKRKAWEILFPTINELEICEQINKLWIDPKYYFQAVKVHGKVVFGKRTPTYPDSNFVQVPEKFSS